MVASKGMLTYAERSSPRLNEGLKLSTGTPTQNLHLSHRAAQPRESFDDWAGKALWENSQDRESEIAHLFVFFLSFPTVPIPTLWRANLDIFLKLFRTYG